MVVQRGSELRVAVVRERSEISRRGVELVRARDVHDDTKVHEGYRRCSKQSDDHYKRLYVFFIGGIN